MAANILTTACGPLHTTVGDGGGDADADGDTGADGDVASDAEVDADRVDVDDADPGGDGLTDSETSERAWLLRGEIDPHTGVRRVEPFPGGGFVAAGWLGRGGQNTIVRFDDAGEVVWGRAYGSPAGIGFLSVTPDGHISLEAGEWLAALDADGATLWQRRCDLGVYEIHGLPDGSVILRRFDEVMRYSPTEGMLWSWHVDFDVHYSEGEASAVTEDGTLFFASGPVVGAMDVDGNLLWLRQWSGGYESDGPVPVTAAVPTEAGGVLLVGGKTISVARLDREGRIEWLRSFGAYERGEPSDECWPVCPPLDVAMDAAVAATGEVMVVGISTSAAERLGWEIDATFYALWLDPDGSVTGTVALADQSEAGGSSGFSVAALAGGGWVVGGTLVRPNWRSLAGQATLAGFGGPGLPGGECPYAAETSLPVTSLTATLDPVEVTVSPGRLEVVEDDEAPRFLSRDPHLERACW